MKSSGGFTWYEVLIVLVVLFVLYALLFPAVSGPGPGAPYRAMAKNDVVQIATAINAFQTEYGHIPSTYGEIQEVGGPLLQTLMGSNTALNPRLIVFLEVPPAKKGKGGLRNGIFVDPWGSPYKIKLDTHGDGKIINAGPSQQPTPVVQKIVAVWNDPSTHSDKASPMKKRKRLVTSWE
jgi:type II secretory pathway pseudopilin PulG